MAWRGTSPDTHSPTRRSCAAPSVAAKRISRSLCRAAFRPPCVRAVDLLFVPVERVPGEHRDPAGARHTSALERGMQPRRRRFCPQRRGRSALPHSDRAPAGNRASPACCVLSAQPCVSAGGDRRRLTRGARRACAECGVPSARRNQLCAFGCRVCALARLRPARLSVEPSPALRTPGALSSTGTGCESSQGEPSWRPRAATPAFRTARRFFRHGRHGRRAPSQAAGHGTVRRARLCKRRADFGTRRSTALRLQATRVAWLRQVGGVGEAHCVHRARRVRARRQRAR
ncbi:hypothetical protein ERJ75_001399700 [Trypanosoma vivax]|nr:hypothetical protein ERJ75_001399700 [Trypanosoma vivax]